MKRRTKLFNMPVDEVDLAMLRMLADREDVTMSALVRRWLHTRYAEVFGNDKPRAPSKA